MERIGIIGGSGLYQLEGARVKEEISLSTPFGEPSDSFTIAEVKGREVIFLPRHGRLHKLSPSTINYRANIYGMKKLGAGWIISVTACGSLKEEIRPLDFVIPTQFIDRTNQARKNTFFDQGIVAHIAFAQPVCLDLANLVYKAAQKGNANFHFGGTYLNMEGPQFSTLAESNLYRSWGVEIIGMTNIVEARLAREAEICYLTLAAVTDYDCWHEAHASVTVDVIMDNLRRNISTARKILQEIIPMIPEKRSCPCKDALQYAIVTSPQAVPQDTRKRLDILLKKYLR